MLPHLGAGAGQGVEDAYMLARLLSNPRTHAGNLEVLHDIALWRSTPYHLSKRPY